MAQKQTEKPGNGGKQQALARQGEAQIARPVPTARRITRTSPVSTMRRMFDEFDSAFFGWSPSSMMRRMLDDMERVFETDFFGEVEVPASEYAWAPRVDVRRRDDKLVVTVDLPGVSSDQIDISAQDSSLVIEGERAVPGEAGDVWQSERSYGRFRRVVSLPEGIDADQANARFDNGVLEITLPIPSSQIGRRVQISTGQAAQAQPAGTQAQAKPAEQPVEAR